MAIKPFNWFIRLANTIIGETVDSANSKERIGGGFKDMAKSSIMKYDPEADGYDAEQVVYLNGNLYAANQAVGKGESPLSNNPEDRIKWNPAYVDTLSSLSTNSKLPVTSNALKQVYEALKSDKLGDIAPSSETEAGLAQAASGVEVDAGLSRNKYVSPYWLDKVLASIIQAFDGQTWNDVLTSKPGANVTEQEVQANVYRTPIFPAENVINGMAAWVYERDANGILISRRLVEFPFAILKQLLTNTTPTDPNNPNPNPDPDPNPDPIKVRSFTVLDVYRHTVNTFPEPKKGFTVLDVIRKIPAPVAIKVTKKEVIGVPDEVFGGEVYTAQLKLYLSDGQTIIAPASAVKWLITFVYYGDKIDANTGVFTSANSGKPEYNISIQATYTGLEDISNDAFKMVKIKPKEAILLGNLEPVSYDTSTITGWAYDKNNPGSLREVIFYEGSNELYTTSTGTDRPDVANTNGEPLANKSGFFWKIPISSSLNDYKAHTLTVKDKLTGKVIGTQPYQLPNPEPASNTIEYIQYRFVPGGASGGGDLLEIQMRDGYLDGALGADFRLRSTAPIQPRPGLGGTFFFRDEALYYKGIQAPKTKNRSYIAASGQNLKSKQFAFDIFVFTNDGYGGMYRGPIIATAYITTGTTSTQDGSGTASFIKVYP